MKRALLVGVNDYDSPHVGDLYGCVNDVKDVHNLLVKTLGYEVGHVVDLTNRQATKRTILRVLSDLTELTKPGDHLFFYFSGHGSQVADQDGDEQDTRDELLCPHDMSWEGNVFIRDDDLKRIFAQLPWDSLLEVVLDCCHSGTGVRSAYERQERYVPTPFDWIPDFQARPRRIRESTVSHQYHVLWAACDDDQTSEEIWTSDNGFRGAFTDSWCSEIRREPRLGRGTVLARVNERLSRIGLSQIPQLEIG